MATEEPKEELGFETALRQLESIVEELEGGKLTLEQSMDAFEKGMKLSKFCNERLNAAEKKVETLMKMQEGEPASWMPGPPPAAT